jgi:hypothetical protein
VATLQQAAVEVPHSGLLRRYAQPKGHQSLFHLPTKPFGVVSVPERRYEVVGEARQLSEATAGLLEASFEPQIEHIVQIDIRKHRADGAALRYAVIKPGDHSVVHHAGLQPFVQ